MHDDDFLISREILIFAPMRESSSPGETLAGPGASRISMTCRACLLLSKVKMVEWKFGANLGSEFCMAVGCFNHDVLMIQPSDNHKNLVEPNSYAKECFLKAW